MGPGDLFLFFGLFREIESSGATAGYTRGAARQHVLFGWLQVAKKLSVENAREQLPWIGYHPHLTREPGRKDAVYIAAERLTLPGVTTARLPGAGLFGRFEPSLRLTAPSSRSPSEWLLPDWFHPKGRSSCLSYHADPSRWTQTNEGVLLRSAARGQEFVLDCNDYPESYGWIGGLLEMGG